MNMDFLNYLYETDVSLRVKDEYQLSERFTVHDYMYGRCHLFALIASQYLGAPLEGLVAPHATHGYVLCHIYCKINKNTILDASGLWNLYSMKDKYDEPGAKIFSDGYTLKKDLLHMMNMKEIYNFEGDEEKNITNYIDKMKKYTVLNLVIKENEPSVDIEQILTTSSKRVLKI